METDAAQAGARRVAVIVTSGESGVLEKLVARCRLAVAEGNDVVVFFRDESIPAISSVTCDAQIARSLAGLAADGHVRLYACSSSAYIWGVTAEDFLPSVRGVRGLVAFLADDLAGASDILTF